MLETLMFAWQTARQDRTVALMAFAMSSSVAETIAGLSPRQLRMIANRDSHSAQIRWASNLAVWQDLLTAAQAGDEKGLAALHLHAKLMLCGEMVK
ncbi:MAG TPA: flagellar transcriptional regulator FlhD [Steroidobacteraceae bacterium]|nr:flagellar transcriptional regulator FlhD [Steroidobacteraceae bacterium]